VGATLRPDPAADREFPAVRRGIVSRRELFERLGEAGRVVNLSAPPGSGKTILLRSWIGEARLAENAGWVSVQGEERDPQRFWISVADALRGTKPGSKLIQALTAAPDLDGWAIVERLLADLGRLEEPIWLVIDDLHELRAEEALRQLELLLMRGPPALRVVLATRHDMRLGMHRLRLEGELTEIRAADLRFGLDDSRVLLEGAGVELSDSALALLLERTEGWAAGLRLAALSLAGHRDPELFAAEFSGSERTVAEYLLAEVLERQPAEVRRLLLRTSILERVSGLLADLMTGDSGGERILQELEEANAFVVSLDAQRSWFRYHRMFADLLQLELRRSEPGKLLALHGAAAGWYAEHGYPIEAIRHAQDAEDWTRAARLLSEHWFSLYFNGRAGTAHELLAGFPAGAVAADAELTALTAADELIRGPLEEAERHLALATRGLASVPAERRGRCEVLLATVRLSLADQRGDLPAAVEGAQRLLAAAEAPDAPEIDPGDDLRAHALISLGTTELWTARLEEAERHLEGGLALARRITQPHLEISGLAHLALVGSMRSPALGVERGMQAIELARRQGWSEDRIVALAYVVVGVTMVWQGRLEEAEEWLGQGERALRAEVEPATGRLLHYARGWRALALGLDQDAVTAFEAAERQAELLVDPFATPTRGYLLQALVRVGETVRVEQGLAVLDEHERERGEIRIALAALRLALDEPEAATVALAPVLDGSARLTNPQVWVVQAFLLEAIARGALGETTAADRALEHALDLAEPNRVLLPFLVQPTPRLLERHARRRTTHASLASEILSLLAGAKPEPAQERSALREPLSQSESRILRYLPTNLTVPEIAGEVYLSANTVKTHMRHLYDKLGAHRRREAVDRARNLGMLAPPAFRSAAHPR
jgi:LuxR family maltose regulon positive regulatory protein